MEIALVQEKSKKSIQGLFVIMFTVIMALTINYTVPTIGRINGSTVIAKADAATDAFNKVQGSKGGVLGSDVKNKVTNLSADIQSIVLTVVMAILIISTLWTSTKFSGAGDNPQKKAALKNALIAQVGGIVFLASYSGLILFGLQNLNIFS